MKEAIISAVEVVDQYAHKQAADALKRVIKEQHGQGCGCQTCAHLWVNEINYWLTILDSDVYFDLDFEQNKLQITGPHQY